MNFFMILLTMKASVSSSFTPDNTRSSFLHTVEDYYLQGHVSHRQMSPSVLSCTQLCLRNRPLCLSLNYDKEGTKICELNDEGIDLTQTGVTSLVPKSGFIFGQLLNLTVSNKREIIFLIIEPSDADCKVTLCSFIANRSAAEFLVVHALKY